MKHFANCCLEAGTCRGCCGSSVPAELILEALDSTKPYGFFTGGFVRAFMTLMYSLTLIKGA